jgi:hypothetical protein
VVVVVVGLPPGALRGIGLVPRPSATAVARLEVPG